MGEWVSWEQGIIIVMQVRANGTGMSSLWTSYVISELHLN